MPANPRNVTVEDITYNSATVRWVDCSDDETSQSVMIRDTTPLGALLRYDVAADVTEYALTQLGGTTTYEVYVISRSPTTGNSESSPRVLFTTLRAPTVPNAPTNLTVSDITTTSARLTWTDNATDETKYTIERTNLRTNNFTTFDQPANTTTVVLSPIPVGTPFKVDVFAVNATGRSVPATIFFSSRSQGEFAPQAPSNLIVIAPRANELEFIFQDNSNNEVEFVCRLYRGSTQLYEQILRMNTTDGVFSGLPSGVVFTVTVFARNQWGVSDSISANGSTWDDLPPIPLAPSDLVVSEFQSLVTRLNWTNNAVYAENINIYRKLGVGAYGLLDSIGPTQTQYRDYDLAGQGGTQVDYKLRAENFVGESSDSNEDGLLLTAPIEPDDEAPTNFIVTQYDVDSVLCSWVDNSDIETGFRVEGSTTSDTGPWTTKGSTGPNQTVIAINGLATTTWWFRVVVSNDGGDIGTSDVVEITLAGDIPAAPTGPTLHKATATSPASIQITFTPSDSLAASFLPQFRSDFSGAWSDTTDQPLGTIAYEYISLDPATAYQLRVLAQNSGGDGPSNTLEATTPRRQGGTGFTFTGKTRQGFTRNVDKDADDIVLIDTAETPYVIEDFVSYTPDATDGPFAEMYINDVRVARANPITGTARLKNHPVLIGDTVEIRTRGTGTGRATYVGTTDRP